MPGPPPKGHEKPLGGTKPYEMSKQEDESLKTRSSAGSDGQGVSPPPVSNERGHRAFEGNQERENWADMSQEENEVEKNTTEESKPGPSDEVNDEENTSKEETVGRAGNAKLQQVGAADKKAKERERREQKRQERERKLQEQRKKLEEFESIFKAKNDWSRYLTLKTDKTITPLELDDYLLSIYASEELSFKNKYNDQNTWIITTTCKEQADKYMQIKEINGSQVTIQPHSEMNSVWGTMVLLREDKDDEDRCRRILEKRHKNVQEVKIIILPRNNTKIAKIKFKGKTLPEKIYMGGRRRDIKPYIPKPSQCHNCSRYGHYKEVCRSQSPACYYCGSHEHESKWQCGGEAKCINCNGNHHARSQKCPFYIYNSQLKHLQIRTGMSIKDARDELKENGIHDPFKRTTYSQVTTNGSSQATTNGSSQGTSPGREEELEPTQQFEANTQVTPERPKATDRGIEDNVANTSNRFAGIGEEELDEANPNENDGMMTIEDLDDLDGFWERKSQPKQQRKGKGQRTPPKETTNGGKGKRSRETSPQENKKKESKSDTSPPTKKGLTVGYSSTSEEEAEEMEEQVKGEEKGMPIPTIITTNPPGPQVKERIPNPFRREDITETDDHPLKQKSPPQKRQVNDLEGVRDELKKMYEESGKQQMSHPKKCGCESCFWDEKDKIGKMTEKRVTDLIESFIKNRNPNTIPANMNHTQACLCIVCIKRKYEENKEAITKRLMNKKETTGNRDPRINKDKT